MATQPARELTVTSPWSNEVVGVVAAHAAADVAAAVARAHAALAEPLPAHERAAILDRAAAIVAERGEHLASVICAEAGKPIAAARVEASRTVDTLRYAAIEARTLTGECVPMEGTASGAGKLAFTLRRPVGVVAAVTPFNFPLNLSAHKVAPAIAAGCSVVHKPASATPLSALELQRALRDAGLPSDRYEVVVGPGSEVGAALASDPRIALVTFTGSGEVGWALRAELPRTRVSLELGNSTPLLAFADADLDAVVDAVARNGYSFAGQSCISVQRLLVERPVLEHVVEALTARVAALPCGDPADERTVVGPLIDDAAADRVERWVSEAIDAGARLTCGGARSGRVIAPAVLRDVTPDMAISHRELFGPAVVVTAFDDERAAIDLANGTPYGLQAGVYTRDVGRALRVAAALEFGGVTVNEAPTFRADQMPYGGVKDSGNTREGPRYAVREMTESTLVVLQREG